MRNIDPSTKWLCVTTQENWKKCLEYGVWGASDNRYKGLKEVKLGDKMLVYIKKMKVAGIARVPDNTASVKFLQKRFTYSILVKRYVIIIIYISSISSTLCFCQD